MGAGAVAGDSCCMSQSNLKTSSSTSTYERHNASTERVLFVVRYVFPALLTIAGFLALVVEPRGTTLDGALGLIGAGFAAFLFAFLARLSMNDSAREEEEEARRFFDEHGYWPDEAPSAARSRRS
jgi:Na+/proline symporter